MHFQNPGCNMFVIVPVRQRVAVCKQHDSEHIFELESEVCTVMFCFVSKYVL